MYFILITYQVRDWMTHEDLDYGIESPVSGVSNNHCDQEDM